MTAVSLLARCRALGIALLIGVGGDLLWEAKDDPPADLLADLAGRKTEVLALLQQMPPWDQAEAERLLAELRAEVEKLKSIHRGQPPIPLARLLDDALVLGERYVRDHEAEAARGWDTLKLLGELLPHVRDITER